MTDTELLEQFQMIMQGMNQMEQRLVSRMDEKIQESEERLTQRMDEKIKESEQHLRREIKESEQRTHVYIENTVCKRLDSLYDGYKLTHEKQWELERETEKLKEQMNEFQTRLDAIEKKVSA